MAATDAAPLGRSSSFPSRNRAHDLHGPWPDFTNCSLVGQQERWRPLPSVIFKSKVMMLASIIDICFVGQVFGAPDVSGGFGQVAEKLLDDRAEPR